MSFKLPDISSDTPSCRLIVLNAGFCLAKRSNLLQGQPRQPIRIPALFFLIQHPSRGNILFDTGYSTRFYAITSRFPYSLMKAVTPVQITEQDNAASQLRNIGIAPEDIGIVLLSHLHADHAGSVHDFAHASIYIDRREWEFGQRSGWRLLRNGYLKPLYNRINPSTINLLDFGAGCGTYGPFEHAIDLLSDGSLILVPLHGHTIGQYGLLLNQPEGRRYFLMADSVYVRANYRTLVTGSLASRLAHYNARLYRSLFPMLRQLEENNPEMVCIPSHDPEAYEQYIDAGLQPQPF